MKFEIDNKYFSEEELKNTPDRFKKFLEEWLVHSKEFTFTTFEADMNEMIIVKDLQFYSMCSHHLLPFFGKAHVGYIPEEKIAGLSKIPRTVDMFAHRPQIQEKLTLEILNYIVAKLKPLWCIVVLEAEHLCMSMRGIKKPGHTTDTIAIYPDPKTNTQFNSAKKEFLRMIK